MLGSVYSIWIISAPANFCKQKRRFTVVHTSPKCLFIVVCGVKICLFTEVVLSTGIEYKYKRGSNELHGLWYTRKGKRFAASKIDRRFSLGNISKHLANNKPLHSQSQWMYADGSIVPIASYKGVRFSTQQINDYVAGKAIRVDRCQGDMPTVWIKFNPQRMTPGVY